MKRNIKCIEIIALVAVIGFAMVACDNGTGTGGGGTTKYAIGDTGPAGGIIFYVSEAGFTVEGYSGATGSFPAYTAHYLEAAPVNEGSIKWSDDTTAIPNVTTITSNSDSKASEIGNGRKDTRSINDFLNGKGESGKAAQVCAGKSLGGKTDWFLPSLGELNLMWVAKYTHGFTGLIGTGWFWSSSQYYSGNRAWFQIFPSGSQSDWEKNGGNSVRAIRAF